VLPVEFILHGRPVSNQTKDKSRLRAWKSKVRHAAVHLWQGDRASDQFVRIKLTHYFEARNGREDSVPDSDNIIKPIREALLEVVYDHDYQVTDVISRRRNLDGSFRVKGISPTLAEGFIQGVEFVHVRVEKAPDPTDLSG
jgi:Holliday junction resolvase RusA-like endonuclease